MGEDKAKAREGEARTKLGRRLLHDRKVQIGLAGVALALAALFPAILMRPPSPADAMRSPMMGRWRAELANGAQAKVECIVDIGREGQANFADTCPAPLMSAAGNVQAVKGGTFAPRHYRAGGDTGTFLFQGGAGDMAGAFWVRGSWLRTRDDRFGEVMWRRISADKPLPKSAAVASPPNGT